MPAIATACRWSVRHFNRPCGNSTTQFYQTGQMTLSLAGPQPLEALQALAQQFSEQLASGPARPQARRQR